MKNYAFVVLEAAQDDLREIARYIAQDNPQIALRWVDMLEERAKTLCQFPEKGRPHKDGYRVLVADRGYRIYYRVEHDREKIVIVHFFSPAQNLDDHT